MTESLTFLAHGAFAALAFEALLSDAETGSLSVGNTVLSELVAWPASKCFAASTKRMFKPKRPSKSLCGLMRKASGLLAVASVLAYLPASNP